MSRRAFPTYYGWTWEWQLSYCKSYFIINFDWRKGFIWLRFCLMLWWIFLFARWLMLFWRTTYLFTWITISTNSICSCKPLALLFFNVMILNIVLVTVLFPTEDLYIFSHFSFWLAPSFLPPLASCCRNFSHL